MSVHRFGLVYRPVLTGLFALCTAVLVATVMLRPQPAPAQDPTVLGVHDAWIAYKIVEGGHPVCYMASTPVKAEGNYTRRGDIFALITHRPAQNARNVFEYKTGYPYRPESTVALTIDGRGFTLFTVDERAFARDSATDDAIAQAVREGLEMVVVGTSARGTRTTDTFSLRGSNAAYQAITAACR